MNKILRKYRTELAAVLIFIVGLALRMSFPQDIEYKGDEAYSFIVGKAMGITMPWSWLGMKSSLGFPNPGMTIWFFVFIFRFFNIETPVGIAMVVQVLNVLAIAGVLWFATKRPTREERMVWLWGAALAAVNPVTVLLHRKIWPHSAFPIFTLILIWAWFRRDRKFSGAFLWGFLGALFGQLHMSGFFFAGGLFFWTLFWNRTKKIPWLYWLVGSALGAIPLIPWAHTVLSLPSAGSHLFVWEQVFRFKYFLYWVQGAFGTNISYSLGHHTPEFLSGPALGTTQLHLAGLANGALNFLLWGVLIGTALYWRGKKRFASRFFVGSESETDTLISAALWGMGFLLTASSVTMHHHYYLVSFPILFLWLARTVLRWGDRWQWLLGVVVFCQLVISTSFLFYIHKNGGAPGADYGPAYSVQDHSTFER